MNVYITVKEFNIFCIAASEYDCLDNLLNTFFPYFHQLFHFQQVSSFNKYISFCFSHDLLQDVLGLLWSNAVCLLTFPIYLNYHTPFVNSLTAACPATTAVFKVLWPPESHEDNLHPYHGLTVDTNLIIYLKGVCGWFVYKYRSYSLSLFPSFFVLL